MRQEEPKYYENLQAIRKYLMDNSISYSEAVQNKFHVFNWKSTTNSEVHMDMNRFGMMRLFVDHDQRLITINFENIKTYIKRLDKWNKLQSLQ